MDSTVRVIGLREVNKALGQIDRSLRTELGKDLKEAAAPVVAAAKAKIGRYQGASIGTIRARRLGARVFVEQTKGKTTGTSHNFGGLQMVHGLIPASDENVDEVFAGVDRALGRYASEAGF